MAKRWKIKEKLFLEKHYASRGARWCGMQLGRTEKSVTVFAWEQGIKGERKNTFKHGDIPWNKGVSHCHEGTFKAGNKARAFKVGQTTIRTKRGRRLKYIKVDENKPLVPLHKYIYEKHYGKVPHGYIFVFLDGDTLNTGLSNIKALSRKEFLDCRWAQMPKRERERFTRRMQLKREEAAVRKQVKALFK